MSEASKTTREGCALVEGEDFYREGAAIVFTARYHLRRGHCCGNGCRHCPFGIGAAAERGAGSEGVVPREGRDY